MNSLNSLTSRRLNRLPKHPSVWEGDRRSIGASLLLEIDGDDDVEEPNGDCILWVDGTQGMVRGINVVPTGTGHEAVVRTLLQAMESPQGPAEPGRPQKIVVRNREIHFFLRGALQDVDIDIEYVPNLPLIDEIFEGLIQQAGQPSPRLPEAYSEVLMTKASQLWQDAPWNVLNEQQILAVEVNRWDIETLYISVLGMAGVEYGVLMYRSLESLRQFRQRVLGADQSPKKLQQAFLEQDCLFLNFELLEEQPDPETEAFSPFWRMQPTAIQPEFGSLHPLEGLRTVLADEEAATFIVALEAMHRFFSRHYAKFDSAIFPTLEGRYRIPNPMPERKPSTFPIRVKTLPDVAKVLTEETAALEENLPDPSFPTLRDDYVPEGALIMLRAFPENWLQYLRQTDGVYHQPFPSETGEIPPFLESLAQDLPVVVIQTSRPKALELIENLKHSAGVTSVCFNWGTDPLTGEEYDLGLLQTGDGQFHLFGEFARHEPVDRQLLTQWQEWQSKTNGYCGIVVAGGVTGSAKGQPRLNQMLGFFEAQARSPEDLNLSPLQLQVAVDWEADL